MNKTRPGKISLLLLMCFCIAITTASYASAEDELNRENNELPDDSSQNNIEENQEEQPVLISEYTDEEPMLISPNPGTNTLIDRSSQQGIMNTTGLFVLGIVVFIEVLCFSFIIIRKKQL